MSRLGFSIVALCFCLAVVALFSRDRKTTERAEAIKTVAPTELPEGLDLAESRKAFVTEIKTKGPSPQKFDRPAIPANASEVTFQSGSLELKGWLSAAPNNGKRAPAVVFLHGGFAFGKDDWTDASPFLAAGFVLFVPRLRGENGNPGYFESFYGEVDDAVAAGEYVAKLPYVDPDRVFLVGYNIGGILATLTAMMPSPYRAAAAFDADLEMKAWARLEGGHIIVYDRNKSEEVRLRDPYSFVSSLRIPLTLYSSRGGVEQRNREFAELARKRNKTCEHVPVAGNLTTMVGPAVKQAIAKFLDGPK